MRFDERAELFGDIDGHVVQRDAMRRRLCPPYARRLILVCVCGDQGAQAHRQFPGASSQRSEPRMIFGCLAQRRHEFIQQRLQPLDRFHDGRRPLLELDALARPAQRVLQIVQVTVQRLRERRRYIVARAAREQLHCQITRQRLQLTARNREAEKVRRDLRQLMRFVDDDRIRARQQVAEALLLQHEVGHQQMMIDDDDVGRLRLAPRLHDVAAIERRAFRARGSCRASR